MLRLVAYFLCVAALAFILSWLADNPGSIVINWQGWIWETNVFEMAIVLSFLAAFLIIAWSAVRGIWQSPAVLGNFFNRRREKRGLEALSSGMIAIGAGDKSLATRYAVQARKALPNEPMTHLLRAQAAQLSDDRVTSRRIFEAMLASPDTEALGLRGLFLEAERENEKEAARQFAERAVKLNPKLTWPVEALFDIQCRTADWTGALETLAIAKKHSHVEKLVAERRRAVLLTAQAQLAEDNNPERAMNLALEAHKLAVGLVPAAAIAGRLLASRGNTPKATAVLQKTWRKAPHPDLAVAYAYARLGDSPRDRLERVRQLASLTPNVSESPVAVANAAIEARDFGAARKALEPLIESRLSQRVCTLMARIEAEQHGNAGGVREWLARAVNAPRDPVWTADGIVSEQWAPVSSVTGALDAFQWRVPVEAAEPRDKDFLAQKIEELVKLGARPESIAPESIIVASDTTAAAAASTTSADTASAQVSADYTASDKAQTTSHLSKGEPVEAEVVEIKTKSAESELAEASPALASEVPSVVTPASAATTSAATSPPVTDQIKTAGAVPAGDNVVEASAGTVNLSGAEVIQTAAAHPLVEAVDAPAAPATIKKPAETAHRKREPKIFVPPHAPDDPGIGEREADELSGLNQVRQGARSNAAS